VLEVAEVLLAALTLAFVAVVGYRGELVRRLVEVVLGEQRAARGVQDRSLAAVEELARRVGQVQDQVAGVQATTTRLDDGLAEVAARLAAHSSGTHPASRRRT